VGNKLEHVFKGPATATEITYVWGPPGKNGHQKAVFKRVFEPTAKMTPCYIDGT
jgi:hypothetical protein